MFLQAKLPATPFWHTVCSTSGFFAGGINFDHAGGCVHHPNQLTFCLGLLAGHTGASGTRRSGRPGLALLTMFVSAIVHCAPCSPGDKARRSCSSGRGSAYPAPCSPVFVAGCAAPDYAAALGELGWSAAAGTAARCHVKPPASAQPATILLPARSQNRLLALNCRLM